jgi:hypothetical protein
MGDSLACLGAGGTGVVAFSPSSIAGFLDMWQAGIQNYTDANPGSTPCTNGTGCRVARSQGGSNNMIQDTSSARPTFTTGISNFTTGLLMNSAVVSLMQIANPYSSLTGGTLVLILQPLTLPPGDGGAMFTINTGGGLMIGWENTAPVTTKFKLGRNGVSWDITGLGPNIATGTPYIVIGTYDGTNVSLRVNGTDLLTHAAYGTTTFNGPASWQDSTSGSTNTWYAGAAIVYNNAISTPNKVLIESWSHTLYGTP